MTLSALRPRLWTLRGLWLGLPLAIASCAAPATRGTEAAPPVRVQLAPCDVRRAAGPALCGRHEVFEDRVARAGRRIALDIVVLPALAPTPAPDPVFYLVGGPGLGAARLVSGDTADFVRDIRRDRDVVFVDQRGTGNSHELRCRLSGDPAAVQSYFDELFPIDKVRACREALEKIADLTLYTTPIAMDDLDEVRAAMGYDRINLYATSYGTLAALQYLRQHPAHVRSLVLAGVTTPAAKQPLHFARAAQVAMDTLIADCATDDTCRTAFPDLAADFAAVLARFDGGPAILELRHPASNLLQPVRLSRGVFVERVRLMLYDLFSASLVPLVIHHAAQGDWVPFGRAALPSGDSRPGIAMGMYLTVTCSEFVATITEDEIAAETRGTFVGEYRTRRHLEACGQWPRADVPPGYYAPVTSSVPVLILSGSLDAATPRDLGEVAARSLPGSRQVLIRNASHDYRADCLRGLVAAFIAGGSPRALDTTCVEHLRRPPFVTDLPARLKQ